MVEKFNFPTTCSTKCQRRIHYLDYSGSYSSTGSFCLSSMLGPDPDYLAANPIEERTYTSKQVQDVGTKYELVEPGYLTSVLLRTCFLHHVDFTAKKTDVADAPVEMFFAELTTTSGVRCVKVCRCMGLRDSFSGDKNKGCCYFTHENVQHPRDGGFSRGGEGLFLDRWH
ncbi:hypothetical protein C5167_035652 [Papaver somniferum]|uniref:DUF3615 domain-containing protein n=1 Tax=Papaver somniferum TaxID=3469 RepID=A0A4Y7KJY5_PAPSO|nr:hypothetical protein C5167_035652 [Papaver somniferum]